MIPRFCGRMAHLFLSVCSENWQEVTTICQQKYCSPYNYVLTWFEYLCMCFDFMHWKWSSQWPQFHPPCSYTYRPGGTKGAGGRLCHPHYYLTPPPDFQIFPLVSKWNVNPFPILGHYMPNKKLSLEFSPT